jgi:hypothetical protein
VAVICDVALTAGVSACVVPVMALVAATAGVCVCVVPVTAVVAFTAGVSADVVPFVNGDVVAVPKLVVLGFASPGAAQPATTMSNKTAVTPTARYLTVLILLTRPSIQFDSIHANAINSYAHWQTITSR